MCLSVVKYAQIYKPAREILVVYYRIQIKFKFIIIYK
jgi:hypothetical protein